MVDSLLSAANYLPLSSFSISPLLSLCPDRNNTRMCGRLISHFSFFRGRFFSITELPVVFSSYLADPWGGCVRCCMCVCVYCWPSRYRSHWIDKLTARILETLCVLVPLTDLPRSPHFRPSIPDGRHFFKRNALSFIQYRT